MQAHQQTVLLIPAAPVLAARQQISGRGCVGLGAGCPPGAAHTGPAPAAAPPAPGQLGIPGSCTASPPGHHGAAGDWQSAGGPCTMAPAACRTAARLLPTGSSQLAAAQFHRLPLLQWSSPRGPHLQRMLLVWVTAAVDALDAAAALRHIHLPCQPHAATHGAHLARLQAAASQQCVRQWGLTKAINWTWYARTCSPQLCRGTSAPVNSTNLHGGVAPNCSNNHPQSSAPPGVAAAPAAPPPSYLRQGLAVPAAAAGGAAALCLAGVQATATHGAQQ